MTVVLVSTIIVAAGNASTATTAPRPDDPLPTSRPAWFDRFAWAVGVCETGKGTRHPDFKHRWGSYGGFAGWAVTTWQLDRYTHVWRSGGKWHGYPLYPWNATPMQQLRVFERGRARGRYWGCIENGGYRSWM